MNEETRAKVATLILVAVALMVAVSVAYWVGRILGG